MHLTQTGQVLELVADYPYQVVENVTFNLGPIAGLHGRNHAEDTQKDPVQVLLTPVTG